MTKQYFKCTLLSDVVFNASLATEGNVQSLDYIPGSNFLGIVAGRLYNDLQKANKAYDVFHSGNVSFGNAYVAIDNAQSYPMPFVIFQDKLKTGILSEKTWINPHQNSSAKGIQWEQHRDGYFNPDKLYIKQVDRKFSLKSAYDAEKRRSKEGAMYGFDSLRKGQDFIFSVDFNETIDSETREKVINALVRKHRVGKSKSAQYGQVIIEKINAPSTFKNGTTKQGELWIYAESNLCFLNEYGQTTFQPIVADFGIKGEIDWEQSQIRTYSYSPWNTYRNTTNTQRDVILKGSVIVFRTDNQGVIDELSQKVGEYQEEGLGRVIYNPEFLKHEAGVWVYSQQLTKNDNAEKPNTASINFETPLGLLLKGKKEKAENEFKIGQAVQDFLRKHRDNRSKLKDITSSQWGVIRNAAIQSDKWETLWDNLFHDEDGILTNGVAYERYWGKKGDGALRVVKTAIETNKDLGKKYVAKLATEMAKDSQRKKPQSNEVHA